jgi:hypothetical protein
LYDFSNKKEKSGDETAVRSLQRSFFGWWLKKIPMYKQPLQTGIGIHPS